MASSAQRSAARSGSSARSRAAERGRGQGTAKRKGFRLFTLFNGEGVPAEIMGPRLLVAVSAIALTIIGIVMVFSASSIEAIVDPDIGDPTYYWVRQLAFAIIGGVLAFLIVRFLPYHAWLDTFGLGFYIFCVLLVILTAFMGVVGLGARRWLTIGGITIQPSEFLKIALMIMSARLMVKLNADELNMSSFLVRFLLFVVLPLGFMFLAQSDMGSTMICVVGILAILTAGGFSLRAIGIFVLIGILFVAGFSMSGYRSDRWIFLDPWSDYYGSGFQVIHSFYAFAQGGAFGQGLGNSAEKYLYLPEAETDFIFSIIGEELGFVGAFIVVALFVAFLVGCLRIAQTAPDDAGSLICVGLSVMLVFQAFLNMGMCVGIAPTTGKPLPFISAGGSSLIASLIIVGIILSVSYSQDESVYQRRRSRLRLLHVQDGASPSARGVRGRVGREVSRTRDDGSNRSGWRPIPRSDGRRRRPNSTQDPSARSESRGSTSTVHPRNDRRNSADNGSLHIVNDYHIPRNDDRTGGRPSSGGSRSGRRM